MELSFYHKQINKKKNWKNLLSISDLPKTNYFMLFNFFEANFYANMNYYSKLFTFIYVYIRYVRH